MRASELDARTPAVRAGAGATVNVDGQVVAPNGKVTVDPGAHVITVTLPGGQPAQKQILVSEREDVDVDLDVAKKSFATRSTARPSPPPAPARMTRAPSNDPMSKLLDGSIN